MVTMDLLRKTTPLLRALGTRVVFSDKSLVTVVLRPWNSGGFPQ
jgi:hypothetical protein